MAKKILKHSRAARRGLIDDGVALDLAKLPKAEPEAVRKSIIRTTITNENLLVKKMELSKIKKLQPKRHTRQVKRQVAVDKLGVLLAKIAQSVARARMVQAARKAGWDQINKAARASVDLDQLLVAKPAVPLAAKLVSGDFMDEDIHDDAAASPADDEPAVTFAKAANPFASLEQDEEA